jgi:hypothetical protein
MGFFGRLFGKKEDATSSVEYSAISTIRRGLKDHETELHKEEWHRKKILAKVAELDKEHKQWEREVTRLESDFLKVLEKHNLEASKVPDGYPRLKMRIDVAMAYSVKLNVGQSHIMEHPDFDYVAQEISRHYVRLEDFVGVYKNLFHCSDDDLEMHILQSVAKDPQETKVLEDLIKAQVRKHLAFFMSVWWAQTWERTVVELSKKDLELKERTEHLLQVANAKVLEVEREAK